MEYYDDNNQNDTNQSDTNQNDTNQNDTNQSEYNNAPLTPPVKPKNSMALASMLCGIFGVLALCGCLTFPLSIILGVSAISLSIFSRKGQPFTGYAVTGLVLGIVSLILGLAEGFYIIAINFMLRDPNMAPIFDQILEQYGTKPIQ